MTKRMKTEYMKKFKGPKWDTYGSCYTDLVQYRNMRRILEQAHIPWVWTEWDSSSSSNSNSSSGASTPRTQVQHWVATCPAASLPSAPQEPGIPPCSQSERPGAEPAAAERPGTEPAAAERPGTEPAAAERPGTEPAAAERPGTEPAAAERPGTEPAAAEPPRTKDFHSLEKENFENKRDNCEEQSKGKLCNYHRVKGRSLEKSLQTSRVAPATVVMKEIKPPFAMYGWAEKKVEVGCKKTFNVGASALRGQIYESAVRAQDRRQVQRAMRISRTLHRGTESHSNRAVDHRYKSLQSYKSATRHSQVRAFKSAGADNPWLSEYMRCFSTRSL